MRFKTAYSTSPGCPSGGKCRSDSAYRRFGAQELTDPASARRSGPPRCYAAFRNHIGSPAHARKAVYGVV